MDLSRDEKIKLITGKGMWYTQDLDGKLTSILLADGPHGIRKEIEDSKYNAAEEATCFPAEVTIASSWDLDIVQVMAEGIAKEGLAKDLSVLLGPGVNIKRLPICGRNFEYFSEDPYLAGKFASRYIQTVENLGLGTSLKHFAVNNQETFRQSANAQVDERALHEIYLRAFEMAVKEAKPATIMASYNRLNGDYVVESDWLLKDILRDKWTYEGLIVSDWSAIVNLPKAIAAGVDLEMPDSLGIHGKHVKKALKEGFLDQEDLDRAVIHILNLVETYRPDNRDKKKKFVGHQDLVRQLANESAVLLKNQGLLPIEDKKEVFIIGSLADKMRFQGGGSSFMNTITPAEEISAVKEFQARGYRVSYAKGYAHDSNEVDDLLVDEAKKLAQRADQIIFFGGLTEIVEGEGYDRQDMLLPENQLHLLSQLIDMGKDIIYVSFSGAPYEFPYLNEVKAFLQMYLAGESAHKSVVDILTGLANPSGKLAETWPKKMMDSLSMHYFDPKSKDLEYRESLFVGYRYFDSYQVEPLFYFGQGMTYTKFVYDNLSLTDFDYEKKKFDLSFDITNIGQRDGQEVAQVYVKNPRANYLRANKELRGFAKVHLKVGQTKRVHIKLDDHAFSIYDDSSKEFIDPSGLYEIQIASAINKIELKEEIYIKGIDYKRTDRDSLAPFFTGEKPLINQEVFKSLYKKKISNFTRLSRGDFTLYNSLDEFADVSLYGKFIRWLIVKATYKLYGNLGKDHPQTLMMIEGARTGPFDAVICQSGIAFLYRVGLSLVDTANGKYLRAVKRFILGD